MLTMLMLLNGNKLAMFFFPFSDLIYGGILDSGATAPGPAHHQELLHGGRTRCRVIPVIVVENADEGPERRLLLL